LVNASAFCGKLSAKVKIAGKPMTAVEQDVVAALTAALGEDCVLTGEAVHERAAGIWRSDTIKAKALLRPRTTQQVSEALAICNGYRQSVVAHGGLTGLVESAITGPDDVALSLERLNAIEEINPLDR
jgi:FAD/FMN-containing dehydrogenase